MSTLIISSSTPVVAYTVTEAAKQMGIRRERASIALGHAQRVVTKLRDDWDA